MNLSVIKENINLQQLDLSKIITESGGDVSFYIGRDDSCRIFLDDMRVSREHAQIKYENNIWHIEKCNSDSIITINGQNVEVHSLSNGDIIGIGPFSLNYTDSGKASIEEVSSGTSIEESELENNEDIITDDESSDENAEETDIAIDDEVTLGLGEEATEMYSEQEGNYSNEESGFDGDNDSVFEDNQEEGFDSEDSEDSEDNFSDEDSYDDDYALESVDEDGTKVLQNFANFYFDIHGEHAPYDKYELKDQEVLIGRDPDKCQIILNDPEVSSVHASLSKKALSCNLEDKNSGNGTILNGERINQSQLKNGDEFIIGSTTFTVRVTSSFLEQEKERMMPVEENQVAIVEEIVEVSADYQGDGQLMESVGGEIGETNESLFSKDALKDPEKRKKILIGLVVLLGLWIMLDDGKAKPKPVKKAKKETMTKEQRLQKAEVKKLTPEEREIVDAHYILVTQYFNEEKFAVAINEADKIYAITPSYKDLNQYVALAKDGVKKLEKLDQERKEQERERRAKLKVAELLIKAEKAVETKKMDLAAGILDEIVSLDPNNDDVERLRREIDFFKKEQDRIAIEKEQKIAERNRQVQALAPGKTYYLQREWFKAISKLSDFLRSKSIDEDLRKEASEMLNTSKSKLKSKVSPMLGKARSLKEGQDLKGSYEVYLDILKIEPSHEEALNEMSSIRDKLENRSKKVYREAIIAESLSLYVDAKEKFQEVQQISPTDSEYYKKATEKLKDYLD